MQNLKSKTVSTHVSGLVILLCLVPLTTTFVGCGASPKTANISGMVYYKGEPVKGGMMTLKYKDSQIDVDISGTGSFFSTNVPVGFAQVRIETESVKKLLSQKPSKAVDDRIKGLLEKVPPEERENLRNSWKGMRDQNSGGAPLEYTKIPSRYSKFEESKLNWEIAVGPNKKDFQLTD